jgi:hypothetical protein
MFGELLAQEGPQLAEPTLNLVTARLGVPRIALRLLQSMLYSRLCSDPGSENKATTRIWRTPWPLQKYQLPPGRGLGI